MTSDRGMTAAEYQEHINRRRPSGATRPWSGAMPKLCRAGHRHPSIMEARVCDRLSLECLATGATLYRQVRFPLLSIAPKKRKGTPETLTVDFVIVERDGTWRAIDAKCEGRISRDWRLRTAAFERAYGREVLEVSS